MNSKPLILVTGATGAQGGGVVKQLFDRGSFVVRALTRRPTSPAAAALTALGAEVVAGDLADRPSLRRALDGCYGVFGVTNYWEHFERELEYGRNLLDEVAGAKVEHLVLSTLPSARQRSGGTLEVPHFEFKAQLTTAAREMALPATFVEPAFYYENFPNIFAPRPLGDGTWGFSFPLGDTPLAAVAVDDVGGIVAPLFERRAEFLGATLVLAGDELPAAGYAAEMSRALGVPVRYQDMTQAEFAALGFPGADDLAAMFELYRSFTPSRAADIELARTLFPKLQPFADWIATHKALFGTLAASA